MYCIAANDLLMLSHLKADAETRQLKLKTSEEKYLEIQKKKENCETDLIPISERIAKIRNIEIEVSKLYTENTALSTK